MAELSKIIAERFAKTIGNDTQEVAARKLNMSQGNISKLVNGEQMPTVDTLVEVSKAYDVSVDWLVGVSECPEIDGLVVEKLTYGQVALVVDKLIGNKSVEVPDLVAVARDKELIQSEDDEDDTSIIDPDFIKVNDRVLSHLLRRREKLWGDPELYDMWFACLDKFQKLRILSYGLLIQEAIDANHPVRFKDGDWVELIQRLSKMSEDELKEEISKSKEMEGR